MTDILLQDIDAILAERLRRVADARGWTVHETILNVLEQGLFTAESEVRSGFDDQEVNVLSAAIAALKEVPPGHGF